MNIVYNIVSYIATTFSVRARCRGPVLFPGGVARVRVPLDRPLASWIRELEAEGRLYLFYKSPEWRALRDQVMADHHWECERCAARGEYARADTVHHEYEVKRRPWMALIRYVDEPDGTRREVLHPLCGDCHNEAHGRRMAGPARRRPQVNEERWD